MSEQFPAREEAPAARRIVHTCFKCGMAGHKQRDCPKSREDRNEERYIPREMDGAARQEPQETRQMHLPQETRQMPQETRQMHRDNLVRGNTQVVDASAVWSGSGSGFVGVPVRGGMPAMGVAHSHAAMHPAQPVHAHQQSIQDLTYQIERIQQIMNELNQLRLPNEIMLQLSDYITHLRKELHRLNLSLQPPPMAAPPMAAVVMEQHHSMMREPVARDGSRGDAAHFTRQEGRGDRNDRGRSERPGKRQWGPADGGGTYIERDGFVGDVGGAEDGKGREGQGYSGNDDHAKRGR